MSACAEPILREAVAIIKAKIIRQRPQLTFDEIKRRLIVEAEKRRQAHFGHKDRLKSASAFICISDWCSIFIRLLDRPEFTKQDQVVETLAIVMDRLEFGENVAISEAMEVFKKL